MLTETLQPCGCWLITDDSPVVINGVRMDPFVASITGVRRCEAHEREWQRGMETFVRRMDERIADDIYRKAMDGSPEC